MNKVASLLRRNVISQVPRRSKAYLGELKGTMNDLPQPSGSWKTNAEAQQRKYTAQLVVGISFFALTIGFGQAAGLFYLNPEPDMPVDKNDYSK